MKLKVFRLPFVDSDGELTALMNTVMSGWTVILASYVILKAKVSCIGARDLQAIG